MIFITGGTGFIGRALIRQLVEMGYPVRILIRPGRRSPNLPKGVPVEVAVTSLNDLRGLRAAMSGVKTVYHLASGERIGTRANMHQIDIQGTRAVAQAAAEAGVDRFFFVSHLGADRASAYPVLKTKAIAEEYVRRSGLDYTILRSAIVYGPGDRLTTGLARILALSPLTFLMPGDGSALMQPLWVDDLVTCLSWSLEDQETRQRTIEIGGPEHLPFRQVVELVMKTTGMKRRLLNVRPPYMRGLSVVLESMLPGLPVSVYWLDYLAANRTCSLDTAARVFNLMPSRMSHRLAYLQDRTWRRASLRSLFFGSPAPKGGA